MRRTISKKLKVPMMLTAFLFALNTASADHTISMTCEVDAQLEIGLELRKFKDGNVIDFGATAMDFGTLTDDGSGNLRGEFYYDVYLHSSSGLRPYHVIQTATDLSNGGSSIPHSSCKVFPWATAKDGVPYPQDAQVGENGSFVADHKLLYQSGAAGEYRAVAATYALEDVPVDQKGGNYATTLTFQICLTT